MILARIRNRYMAILHDTLMIPVAWYLAMWLRFNLDDIPRVNLNSALADLVIIVPVQMAVSWMMGLYRGVWRYASIPDLLRIMKAVIVGVCASVILIFLFTRLEGIPRSMPLLYGILLFLLWSGPRFVYRWFKDHRFQSTSGARVLIVGAGSSGEMLVRDLLRDPEGRYMPVAFVDDDREKQGREIHRVRVCGDSHDIPSVVRKYLIDIIILAIPSARSSQMRRIVSICEKTGLPIRTLPHLSDLVSGSVSINALRKVSIEDLLGREPVKLDSELIGAVISGKTIMVTGAGGSIGSELCRQITGFRPERLVVVDNSEYNLYQIELELKEHFPDMTVDVCLNDVTDRIAVDSIFDRFRPDIVFHAAAYKHVPLLQYQARTAVYNNIIGTAQVADAADRFGVASFVLISTDKAVNPTNIMGATKRVCEKLCKYLDKHSETRFIVVRFGNVLGSAGSVVPLFEKQIARGGPVTVTHPDITRYFMTIPESCQLIMQAGAMGEGGETFVLDMGEPVKIAYLAEQMITLAGKVPCEDIEIVYTGLRPGEKLYEELFYDKEALSGTNHAKIMLSRYQDVSDDIMSKLDDIRQACNTCDEKRIKRLLCELVPEYRDESGLSGEETAKVIQMYPDMRQ